MEDNNRNSPSCAHVHSPAHVQEASMSAASTQDQLGTRTPPTGQQASRINRGQLAWNSSLTHLPQARRPATNNTSHLETLSSHRPAGQPHKHRNSSLTRLPHPHTPHAHPTLQSGSFKFGVTRNDARPVQPQLQLPAVHMQTDICINTCMYHC